MKGFTLSNKKVSVIGLGLSGRAAARLLIDRGARVAVTDDKNEQDLEDALRNLEGMDIDYHVGGVSGDLLCDSDLVVISPGVPSYLPAVENARRAGIEIISELELAYRFCNKPIIAITGTNGKTTTTMLVHHIVNHAGLNAALAGNIEIPFCDVVQKEPFDMVILEVSSFQLENIGSFTPSVGVLLNLSSDHLDRYRNLDDYLAAKVALFSNQSSDDTAVLNLDDPVVAGLADKLKAGVVGFSLDKEIEKGAYLRGTRLMARLEDNETEIMDREDIPLLGQHNVANVLAAIAATLPLEIPTAAYGPAVNCFPGAEHRLEIVREIDGILYVNDSKATNVGALEKSLMSFDRPIVLIAGGRGKKGGYRGLRELVEHKVRAMITIGEDAPLLEEALGDLVPAHRADTLPDAVLKAAEVARSGDCVLLAPACASFDMFDNYSHRGRVFKEAVQGL